MKIKSGIGKRGTEGIELGPKQLHLCDLFIFKRNANCDILIRDPEEIWVAGLEAQIKGKVEVDLRDEGVPFLDIEVNFAEIYLCDVHFKSARPHEESGCGDSSKKEDDGAPTIIRVAEPKPTTPSAYGYECIEGLPINCRG